jgi:glucosamine-6-phosphate deaminase
MPRLNLLEETRFEKLPVTVYPDKLTASKTVAKRIAEVIRKKAAKGENAVLGLSHRCNSYCSVHRTGSPA